MTALSDSSASNLPGSSPVTPRYTDYCSDALLTLWLDRWRLPAVLLPVSLGLLITAIEFGWGLHTRLLVSRDGILGMFDDPAYYLSTWIGGFAFWFYYAWMPGGIHRMFLGLRANGVIQLSGEAEAHGWQDFMEYVRDRLGSPWISRLALLVSAAAAFLIYFPSIRGLNGWASQSLFGRVLVTLWILGALYCVIQVVVRQVLVTRLVSQMLERFRLNVRPLHPDKSGGLSPLGNFALKSTYLIAVTGFVIVFMTFNRQYQATGEFGQMRITSELILAGLIYLLLAPVSFLAPLSTAHRAMKEAKDGLLLKLARAFEDAYERTHAALTGSKDAALALDDLRDLQEMHELTERFPVWPYNAETLRRLFASILSPIVLAVLPSLISLIFLGP